MQSHQKQFRVSIPDQHTSSSDRFVCRFVLVSDPVKISFAKITITLSNTGLDAFKFEEYGHEIVIERTIRQKGSTYRVLNSLGKSVKNSKHEVDLILESFNIQVNNPFVSSNLFPLFPSSLFLLPVFRLGSTR